MPKLHKVHEPLEGPSASAPRGCARALASLGIVLASLSPAGAQDPELITDRPDQTESTTTVPRGWIQIESGAGFAEEDSQGLETQTLAGPGTLVRIGLADRLELRLGWAGFIDQETSFQGSRTTASGVGDAEIGAKLQLRGESGRVPEMAILFATSVPSGDDGFTSDRFDPSFRLAFAHTLSERVSLGYNFGAAWESTAESGDTDTLSNGVYTVAAGFALSEHWGAFVELFGDVALSASGAPAHSLDGGTTWRIKPNLQIDLAGGLGLSDAADDWFLGVGVSLRLPR